MCVCVCVRKRVRYVSFFCWIIIKRDRSNTVFGWERDIFIPFLLPFLVPKRRLVRRQGSKNGKVLRRQEQNVL